MCCSNPSAPIPSDETAQALENRLRGATLDLPAGTQWEGKHKMSLSSQAPYGRKASPLEGFPRKDLQILAGSGADSTCGKAQQASGEAAGDIRTGRVLSGRLCRDKGTEAVGSETQPDLSANAALQALVAPSLSFVPGVSSVTSQPSSPWGALSSPPLFSWIIPRKFCSGLKKQRPEQCSCLLSLVRGTFSLLT